MHVLDAFKSAPGLFWRRETNTAALTIPPDSQRPAWERRSSAQKHKSTSLPR